MKRNIVREELKIFDAEDFLDLRTLSKIATFIRNLQVKYSDYDKLRLEPGRVWDSERLKFALIGDRPETDKEYEKRLAVAKAEEDADKERNRLIEAKELKELERLKKKYEKANSNRS